MRVLLFILAVALCGIALGGASAWYSIQSIHGFGAIRSGPWAAFPFAGQSEVDPYTIAKSVAEGSVPIGATEGLAFEAITDSAGDALQMNCSYVLEGKTPPSKLWTLVAYQPGGDPAEASPGGRPALYSGSILHFADGSFRVAISSLPEPGNWMGITGKSRFRLVLRLYDTPITSSSGLIAPVMPKIERKQCS